MHTATESRFPSHAAGFAPLPAAARRWEEHEAWREGFHAITGVAFEAPQARKPLPLVRKEATVVPASDGDRKFKIRAAHSTNHRGSASMLIDGVTISSWSLPSSFMARYASFSQEMRTSPMCRSTTKVLYDGRGGIAANPSGPIAPLCRAARALACTSC